MQRIKDLTGQKFGKLTIIGYDGKKRKKENIKYYYYWFCKCACDDKKIISVSSKNLKRGVTKNCGCINVKKEKMKEMIGRKFGRLTVLPFYKTKTNSRVVYWRCICNCINKTIVYVYSGHLKKGATRSCGCLQKEIVTKHGMFQHPFYNIWRGIKTRCDNSKDTGYKNYGGMGISYDKRWEDFLEFKKDMYQSYVFLSKKYRKEINKKNVLSIERIDSNKNYCKENCTWIPLNEQAKNTKRLRWFKATKIKTGETIMCRNQSEFARQYKLNGSAINGCLTQPEKRKQHKGWKFCYIVPERSFEQKIIKK